MFDRASTKFVACTVSLHSAVDFNNAAHFPVGSCPDAILNEYLPEDSIVRHELMPCWYNKARKTKGRNSSLESTHRAKYLLAKKRRAPIAKRRFQRTTLDRLLCSRV